MNTPENRYQVIETLGTGATSRVDKARDTLIGRTVALKSFLQSFGSRDLEQQFLREAQIIGGLSHPNIVALYDVGTGKDGAPYLVMEYVEGKTLESILEAGPLPLPRLAAWGGDLATALGQAHRASIIHGDVKPANILVTDEQQIKLGDFGIAHFSTQASASGDVLGTPAYLSPEQILGAARDSRSDLFSLGIVLYQMATGVRPFDGDSVGAVCGQIILSSPPPPTHHNPFLPAAFDQIVMRCLSKKPEERYLNAEALAASLYPFARSNGAASTQARSGAGGGAKLSWWNRPWRQNDGWTVAGVLLIFLSLGWTIAAARKHAATNLTGPAAEGGLALGAAMHNAPLTPVAVSDAAAALAVPSSLPSAVSPSLQVTSEASQPTESQPVGSKSSQQAHIRKMRPQTTAASRQSSRDTSVSETQATVLTPIAPPVPKPMASLRVEIISAIAEETVAVYSGQDVLLTKRLEPGKVREPLYFNCPLSPGAHPLRVALYRADESLHIQKEGFAEIVADGSNTLDIRVNRHSRLLLRKDATLEVVWPNMHSTAAKGSSPLDSATALSK